MSASERIKKGILIILEQEICYDHPENLQGWSINTLSPDVACLRRIPKPKWLRKNGRSADCNVKLSRKCRVQTDWRCEQGLQPVENRAFSTRKTRKTPRVVIGHQQLRWLCPSHNQCRKYRESSWAPRSFWGSWGNHDKGIDSLIIGAAVILKELSNQSNMS